MNGYEILAKLIEDECEAADNYYKWKLEQMLLHGYAKPYLTETPVIVGLPEVTK